MDETQQNVTPDTSVSPSNPTPAPAPENTHALMGSIRPYTGVLLLLLILVVGGIQLWPSLFPEPEEEDNYMPLKKRPPQNAAMTSASTSDELNALETDLNGDPSSIEQDLGGIDAAFEAGTR